MLKPGGCLLNYDGNYYLHYYDEEYRKEYEIRQMHHGDEHKYIGNVDVNIINQVARDLPLSRQKRPQWDMNLLLEMGARRLETEVDRATFQDENGKKPSGHRSFYDLCGEVGDISMVRYILKRLLQLVVVLLGVTFLTFMITQATPSDAAEMKYVSMGMMPSTELLEKTREEMGLNDPVLIQYGRWLGNVLHGDLGESSKFGESVWTQMTRKLPMTLKLAGVSLIVVIVFSFPLGILSAVKKTKWPII